MIEACVVIHMNSASASAKRQAARNRRSSRMITAFGKTQCQIAWAEEVGIGHATISQRLKHGWSMEEALTTPTGGNRFLKPPGPFAFNQLESILPAFRTVEMIPIICSGCAVVFQRSKKNTAKGSLNRNGIFCSPRCGAETIGKPEFEIVDGVAGRTCLECSVWKPCRKFGKQRVCNTCNNAAPQSRFADYRKHATARGLSFELTFEQFLSFWMKPCWYCGLPIATVGIDRANNLMGYSIGNCLACCSVCNRAKRALDQEVFLDYCRRIAVLHPAKP